MRGGALDEEKDEAKHECPSVSVESVLFEAYGRDPLQLGHKTDGHVCLTEEDREAAASSRSSLLYGEVLPAGVSRILDADHLDAASASVLYDFGMGTGKLALQGWCLRTLCVLRTRLIDPPACRPRPVPPPPAQRSCSFPTCALSWASSWPAPAT